MMKKKAIILMLVGIVCLTACGQPLSNQPIDTPIQEEQELEGMDGTDDLDNKEEENQEQITALEEDESNSSDTDVKDTETPIETAAIMVYSSNDDATAFVFEELQISELSPEAVLGALVDKGVITSDIEIRSFQITTVEGKASIEIDFNNAFAAYVMSTGSTGEYYIIGSICNTFLETYNCEQIKITVEGAVMETGHKDYPGYMNRFS